MYKFQVKKSSDDVILRACADCSHYKAFKNFGMRCANPARIDVTGFQSSTRLKHFKKGVILGDSGRPFRPLTLDYQRGCDQFTFIPLIVEK